MKRVGIVVHPTRRVRDGLEVVESWAADRDLELVRVATAFEPGTEPDSPVGACDLIVALGGDGTILKSLHAAASTGTPVLGVAYGSLGALTTVPTDELRLALDRFAAGDWRARELPALVVEGEGCRVASAINDFVVARGGGTQLLVDVCVDGELYVRLAGDGAVVATPLGSSAYSMAAGGSLLAETADAFLCTPLSMHGGCAPPVVVPGAGEITLDVHPGHSGHHVDIDGFAVGTDALRFRISKEDGYAVLVALDESRTSFPRLRVRGLISDSPRVAGQRHLATQTELAADAER